MDVRHDPPILLHVSLVAPVTIGSIPAPAGQRKETEMSNLKATIALALVSGIIAASGTTVHAAPDLPILVDMHYELKNPAGPVSTTVVPEELKQPYIVRTAPKFDIEDIPNPQWEQQMVVVGR